MVFPTFDRHLPLQQVHYLDTGTNVSEAIVLLHGIGGNHRIWLPVVERLAPHHRVLALDLAGFGRSALPRQLLTVRYQAGILAQFITSLGLSRVLLVGTSLGGTVALRYTLNTPGAVAALALQAPFGVGPGWPIMPGYVPRWLGAYLRFLLRGQREDDFEAIQRLVFHQPENLPAMFRGKDAEWALTGKMSGRLLTALGVGLELGWPGQRLRFLGEISLLRTPALVVWGRHDLLLPLRWLTTLQVALPHAVAQVYEDAGHGLVIEQAGRFAGDVLALAETSLPSN